MMFPARTGVFDLAVPLRASLGEGPAWLTGCAELIWVDIDRGALHRYSPGTGNVSSAAVGGQISSAVPRVAGGLMVTVRQGFAELSDGRARVVASVERSGSRTRMNDGACDRAGRYWAGTMSDDGAMGGLWRLDPNRKLTRVLSGVSISNGIGWSPDDVSMYYVDSATTSVDKFDYDVDSGRVSRRRSLIDIPPRRGKPDGIAVDDEGCIWVALWGGGAVHRYSPRGRLDMRLELPVSQVTSCCFGGDDLCTLFVTTAARGVLPKDELAGSVFACRPGVSGPPAFPFAA